MGNSAVEVEEIDLAPGADESVSGLNPVVVPLTVAMGTTLIGRNITSNTKY